MFSKKNNTFNLETEGLFGESFQIIKIENKFCYGKLLTDNYLGWMKLQDLGELPQASHRVIAIRTIVYKCNDIKSKSFFYLPLGSQVKIISKNKQWAKITLNSTSNTYGFIPLKHLTPISSQVLDWVKIAESLMKTPYKWGGRDSISIDCSSLVQLSLQAGGISIPRNSSQQKLFGKLEPIDINEFKRGNLMFWDGHVGILISKDKIIHSNAFHMMVSIENLSTVFKRLGNPSNTLKLIN